MAHLHRLMVCGYLAVLVVVLCLLPLTATAQSGSCDELHAQLVAQGNQRMIAYQNAFNSCGGHSYCGGTNARFEIDTEDLGNGQQRKRLHEYSTGPAATGSQPEEYVWPWQTCSGSDPLQEACAALAGQSVYIQVPGRALPGSTVCGQTGCQMTVSGTVIIGKQGGATVTEGDATFTSSTCTPNPESQASPDQCPNGQPGQVNGVNVCVPFSEQNTLESIKEETEQKDDSEFGQEQKSTTKQTICTGNSCTTTTTTTTVTNGGTPKTTTTEKTESKDDFCTVNPKAPQCTSSSFGGSCGSFSCAGDAVQCAIAREQHTRNCQMFSSTSQETQQYETSKAETGNRTSAVPITPVAISPGSFDQTPVFGSGACIVDLQVTVWGSQLALPLSTICPQLEWLRALLLTISFLLAVRIVSRG